jgi:hypothetical protein
MNNNAPKIDDYFIDVTTVTNADGIERQQYNYDWPAYYAAQAEHRNWLASTHRERLTAEFEKRGIVTARLEFSGGNDSGGVDAMSCFDKDGNNVHVNAYQHMQTFNHVTGKWETPGLSAEQISDNEFVDLLEFPIQNKWGSWAGDFSAGGTLYYDMNMENGYYLMEYEETSYESYEEIGR